MRPQNDDQNDTAAGDVRCGDGPDGFDPWMWRSSFAPSGRRGRRGRGPGRGGPGRGGPGRGGFGPGRGGFAPGGRRANRGDVRAAILALLAEEPMHGYQIISELDQRTGGAWKPSPGSVYPTVQMLEDEGLVRAEAEGGKNVVHLTEAGREAAAAGEPAPWEAVAGDAGQLALRNNLGGLIAAFKQVAQTGSPDQVQRASTVLNDARKALYGILAEDLPSE